MFDPHDDTDVPSGSTDGAQMESTSSPVSARHYDEGRKEKKTNFAGAPGTCGVVLCPLIPEEASSQIELAPLPRKVRSTFCPAHPPWW